MGGRAKLIVRRLPRLLTFTFALHLPLPGASRPGRAIAVVPASVPHAEGHKEELRVHHGALIQIQKKPDGNRSANTIAEKDIHRQLKEHFADRQGKYKVGQEVLVMHSEAHKSLDGAVGRIQGPPRRIGGDDFYNVEIDYAPRGSTHEGPVDLSETAFLPFLRAPPHEEGVAREGQFVKIDDSSGIPKEGVITSARWRKHGDDVGRWTYMVAIEADPGVEGGASHEELFERFANEIQPVGLADMSEEMRGQHISGLQHLLASKKRELSQEQNHRKLSMSETQRAVYDKLIESHAEEKFPTLDEINDEMKRQAKSPRAKMKIGKRFGIIERMIKSLVPSVAKARILAGADDRIQGMEGNIEEWGKQGLVALGAARGEKKLANVVLDHFKHAQRVADDNGLFRERQITEVAEGLEAASQKMPVLEKMPVLGEAADAGKPSLGSELPQAANAGMKSSSHEE